jgi:hypothetical protein
MLADPFVVEHQGRYWAIGTAYEGFDATLGPFPAVVSDDLVHWIDAGADGTSRDSLDLLLGA